MMRCLAAGGGSDWTELEIFDTYDGEAYLPQASGLAHEHSNWTTAFEPMIDRGMDGAAMK